MFFIILGSILWVMVALWPAFIAKGKGRSFLGYFILSLFFWWITLFVTLAMQDKTRPQSGSASAGTD